MLDVVTGEVRAIFVLNSLNVGGSERKIVRLVNALRRRGISAGIAYLNESSALRSSIDRGVPVWHLERRGKLSLRAALKLRHIVREARPAVVFSVNLYPVLYVSLATMGLPSGARRIGLLNTTAPAKRDEWRRSFYRPFLGRLDSIVFGCELQRAEWVPYVRSTQTDSTVIYNGVDTLHFFPVDEEERIEGRERIGIAKGAFVIGSVGRLAPEKNQGALIDAVANLRANGIDAHLLIVGEGPERAALEHRARERDCSAHVTFAGVQNDVRPWLGMMDVFVLPSTNVETFSNAALEAMAMQKPAILSRIGGADEMIRHGVDGYVVDIELLSETLPTLLRRLHEDATLRDRLGRSARERVEQRFSMDAMIERFAALIEPNQHRTETV